MANKTILKKQIKFLFSLTEVLTVKIVTKHLTGLMFGQIVLLLALSCQAALANNKVSVNSLRFWTAPDHTRLVFGISSPAEHKIFPLENPSRLVLDIKGADFKGTLPSFNNHSLVSLIREGVQKNKDLRIVLDLKKDVVPKSFLLKPNKSYGHRLVIDLYPKKSGVAKKPKVAKTSRANTVNKKWIIAIDAGHGGEDPGAKGYRGTREKDVVLAIAKKLARKINQQANMKAYLVRTGDYYIGLRQRMKKARDARADLFISIHADAFKDQRAHGSSVYVLSNRGASSEAARWLADSENAADLVGGVSLDDKDDMLASVLLDLSQNATKDASATVAKRILTNLKYVGRAHKKQVQRAGFMVLKSPDIPSILIETAFISNRNEEKKLRSPAYQTKIATAVLKGVKSYFAQQVRQPVVVANGQYKVKKGDTLSAIAQRYDVSLSQLKKFNAIKSNRIRVGQVIKIPS